MLIQFFIIKYYINNKKYLNFLNSLIYFSLEINIKHIKNIIVLGIIFIYILVLILFGITLFIILLICGKDRIINKNDPINAFFEISDDRY